MEKVKKSVQLKNMNQDQPEATQERDQSKQKVAKQNQKKTEGSKQTT